MCSFAVVFFLVLQDSRVEYELDFSAEFSSLAQSHIAVLDMMMGSIDIDYFRRSQNPLASLLLLVIFVCVIPIVMLNALIAIMVSDI
jgi:hypothetical protein